MQTPPPPRSLRDLLRRLRRHAVLIGLTTVIAAAAAVGLSVGQAKSYTATATMNFVDPLSEAGIIGAQQSNQAAVTFAAAGVDQIDSDKTLSEVKADLKISFTVSQLQNKVSALADPATNLVSVTATGSTGSFAANLANTVASQVKADVDQAAQQQFARLAHQYQLELSSLTPTQQRNQLTTSTLISNLARARAVANGGATAALIVANAVVPTSPTSPKPATDGILGAVLGFVLGLAIAALLEALDRRLRDDGEIEAELGGPVVGRVHEESLGKVAVTGSGTAQISPDDLEAFRIVTTNVMYLNATAPPRIVAVTSALPEEGKTTVASTLAFAAAASGRRTLLVECDLRRPTIPGRYGIRPTPGLADFLAGTAEPREVVQAIPVELGSDSTNGVGRGGVQSGMLACITAGSRSDLPGELLASNRFRDFLRDVAGVYDLVVLDTPPVLPVADTLRLIPFAQAVLVCVRASRTKREHVRAVRTALDRLPRKPVGVVITGVRDKRDVDTYYYARIDEPARPAKTTAAT